MDVDRDTPSYYRSGGGQVMVFDEDYPPDDWNRWFVLDTIDVRECKDHSIFIIGLRIRNSAAIYGCLECGVRYERKNK